MIKISKKQKVKTKKIKPTEDMLPFTTVINNHVFIYSKISEWSDESDKRYLYSISELYDEEIKTIIYKNFDEMMYYWSEREDICDISLLYEIREEAL